MYKIYLELFVCFTVHSQYMFRAMIVKHQQVHRNKLKGENIQNKIWNLDCTGVNNDNDVLFVENCKTTLKKQYKNRIYQQIKFKT